MHSILIAATLLTGTSTAVAAAAPTRDQLIAADYQQGRTAFLQRCSACHTLAEGASNLLGPNLWGLIGRKAGASPDFSSSPALSAAGFKWDVARVWEFLAGPEQLIPGTSMLIPEPVPAADRAALLSFMLLEVGGADWPRPANATVQQKIDRTKPLAERFPSFFNHLMTNTTRYRMETAGGDVRFDIYFNADGSASSSVETIRGFWNTVERKGMEFFCYALNGIPAQPSQLVECFPIAAMAIPRFADPLWTSKPTAGVVLHGGIVAGRP